MVGDQDCESHLIDLSPPSPLEPSGKHTNKLHCHRRSAFPAAATVGPPRGTAESKQINTGVPGNPMVLPQDEQPTHLPIGPNLGDA